MTNETGRIHSWDLSTGVDGPGTRFVLFLSGCPLRCLYCHNPDTWRMKSGRSLCVDDILAELHGYARFIQVAGGGVTISGGEPLMQPRFVSELLRRCKERGLHTALDTSGYGGARADDELLDRADLVLLDIKSYEPARYRSLTGVEVAPTLAFARRLAARMRAMWIRFVLVPGVTDDESNIEGIARFVSELPTVERVEVLPFHRLGMDKYRQLGLPVPLADTEPPSATELARVRSQFAAHGLNVF